MKFDDRLNPIFVKEMRQYFHNRWLVSMFGLALLALLITFWVAQNGLAEHWRLYGVLPDDAGQAVSDKILIGFILAGFLICGCGVMSRFIAERQDVELDYSRISALSPHSIVRGKIAGMAVVTLLLLSTSLPFLVIAFFLRGVSFLWLGNNVAAAAFAVLFIGLFGVLLGTTGNRATYLFLPIFGGLGAGIGLGSFDSNEVVGWEAVILILNAGILFFFFYRLSVALTTRAEVNRMLPVRLTACAAWGWFGWLCLLSLVLDQVWGHIDWVGRFARMVCISSSCYFALICIAVAIVAAWEPLVADASVLIGKARPLRPLRFLLTGGAMGGIVLVCCVEALFVIVMISGGLFVEFRETLLALVALGGLGVSFVILCVGGTLLLRKWLHRWAVWQCFALLLCGFGWIPTMLYYRDGMLAGSLILLVGLLCIGILLLTDLRKSFREFRMPDVLSVPRRMSRQPAAFELWEALRIEPRPSDAVRSNRSMRFAPGDDRLGAWEVLLLRRVFHGKVWLWGLSGVAIVALLHVISWYPRRYVGSFVEFPNYFPLLLTGNALVPLLCMVPAVYLHEGGMVKAVGGRHFADFSPFDPLCFFWCVWRGYLMLWLAFTLFLSPVYLYTVIRQPDLWSLLLLWLANAFCEPLVLLSLFCGKRFVRLDYLAGACVFPAVLLFQEWQPFWFCSILLLGCAVAFSLAAVDALRNRAWLARLGVLGLCGCGFAAYCAGVDPRYLWSLYVIAVAMAVTFAGTGLMGFATALGVAALAFVPELPPDQSVWRFFGMTAFLAGACGAVLRSRYEARYQEGMDGETIFHWSSCLLAVLIAVAFLLVSAVWQIPEATLYLHCLVWMFGAGAVFWLFAWCFRTIFLRRRKEATR